MFNFSQYRLNLEAIKFIPEPVFFLFIMLYTLFLLYYFTKWYKNFIQVRLISDMPTSKIRSAAQGYCALNGIQRYFQNTPQIAPLSKLPCTWYRFVIQKISKNHLVTLEKNESTALFVLEDETGECIINPIGGQVTTSLYHNWRGFRRYPKGKPSSILSYLISTFGPYRYHEWRMVEGMKTYAIGNFHSTMINNTYSHTLSKSGRSQRMPFVITASEKKRFISKSSFEACMWLFAMILLFGLEILLISIRF